MVNPTWKPKHCIQSLECGLQWSILHPFIHSSFKISLLETSTTWGRWSRWSQAWFFRAAKLQQINGTGLKLIEMISYCSTNHFSRLVDFLMRRIGASPRISQSKFSMTWCKSRCFGCPSVLDLPICWPLCAQKTKIAAFRHLHHDDGILVHCIGARLLDITGARNYSILQPKTASCENGPSMFKLISNLNTSQHIFNYLHIHILLILNIGIRQKLSWKVCFPSPVANCRQVQREKFIWCLTYPHYPPCLENSTTVRHSNFCERFLAPTCSNCLSRQLPLFSPCPRHA